MQGSYMESKTHNRVFSNKHKEQSKPKERKRDYSEERKAKRGE